MGDDSNSQKWAISDKSLQKNLKIFFEDAILTTLERYIEASKVSNFIYYLTGGPDEQQIS